MANHSNPFTRHPHSVNETYWQHLRAASYYGTVLFLLSVASLVHAVFPFFFTNTTSRVLFDLVDSMKSRGNTTDDKDR